MGQPGPTDQLVLEVFDDDIGRDDALGSVRVPVADVYRGAAVVRKWIPLEKCKTGGNRKTGGNGKQVGMENRWKTGKQVEMENRWKLKKQVETCKIGGNKETGGKMENRWK